MNAKLKKTWNIISTVLVAVVVILALLLAGARLLGMQVFTVLSGSMEPAYHTGSIIYVKKIATEDIQPGTVITFMLDEDTVATHRVTAVVPDQEDPTVVRFRTKGDANNAEDGSLVHYKNVIGTPVFTIPGLGYVANYIQHPPGTYVAISAAAVLLLLVFLPDVLAPEKKRARRNKRPIYPVWPRHFAVDIKNNTKNERKSTMKKKIVALCLCIALAVVAIGGATLAYFTDTTPAVKNTFTVGNVDIDLTETTGSSYTVIPGVNITKDPKVTVKADSATSYVFVKVEKNNWNDTMLSYTMGDGWTQLMNDSDPAAAVAGVFYRVVNKPSIDTDFPVIKDNKITVSNQITGSTFTGDVSLTFTAYAIQKETFNTPYAAWTEVSKPANP